MKCLAHLVDSRLEFAVVVEANNLTFEFLRIERHALTKPYATWTRRHLCLRKESSDRVRYGACVGVATLSLGYVIGSNLQRHDQFPSNKSAR
jgi:hypothetical protein